MALAGLKHFVAEKVTGQIDRSVRKIAKGRAALFFHGTAATDVVALLRSQEYRAPEPTDKKSSEWLLWFMLENRKEMCARLIEALQHEEEISGEVVKMHLRPLLAEVMRLEDQAGVSESISTLQDSIAQAVLRLLIEMNHTIAEVIAQPKDGSVARDEHESGNLSSLYKRVKTAARSRMSHVVPATSQSETLKKTGRLIIAVARACGA